MSSLLVMAHPGHELPISEFVRRHRPTVCVLTDGSGGAGAPRLDRTRALLERYDAPEGPLFGMGSDADFYAWILAGETERFVGWARTLARLITEHDIAHVLADPLEGFNPVHDLCRYLVDAGCRIAEADGWSGANLAYALDGPITARTPACGDVGLELVLDDAALERKVAVARAYAELTDEVEAALREHGAAAFEVERFFVSTGDAHAWDWGADGPAYEVHGRERVGRGRYAELITWRDHVLPIARALGPSLVPSR